jgi:hypothetical protein
VIQDGDVVQIRICADAAVVAARSRCAGMVLDVDRYIECGDGFDRRCVRPITGHGRDFRVRECRELYTGWPRRRCALADRRALDAHMAAFSA